MTSLPISRKVLRARIPFVMLFLVEMVTARQAVMSGVYNGDPGFGFNSARYYVNCIQGAERIRSSRFYLL
jgi:hypothetical protein